MERIIVGVDGSKNSLQALHWAAREAALRGAALVAVHVWQLNLPSAPYPVPTAAYDVDMIKQSGDAVLAEAIAAVDTASLSAPVERVLVEGSAAHALLREAEHADLLVVGARGRGGFLGLLLGSVSYQIVHHATCPVVVVPAQQVATATDEPGA
jgi:nucleotide-binding universal stress UspA family protein